MGSDTLRIRGAVVKPCGRFAENALNYGRFPQFFPLGGASVVLCDRVGTADDRYTALLEEIRAEFPAFRIVRKTDSAWQRAIDRLLRALTAGRMTSYLSSYQTTIGHTVYVTPDWDQRPADERYVTMRHERVHMRQFSTFTLPVMAVLYVLLPLPAGLAWFRARFEKQAYEESIRAAVAVYGPQRVTDPAYRRHIESQFTGPSYGWMWPFPRAIARWYDRAVRDALAACGGSS